MGRGEEESIFRPTGLPLGALLPPVKSASLVSQPPAFSVAALGRDLQDRSASVGLPPTVSTAATVARRKDQNADAGSQHLNSLLGCSSQSRPLCVLLPGRREPPQHWQVSPGQLPLPPRFQIAVSTRQMLTTPHRGSRGGGAFRSLDYVGFSILNVVHSTSASQSELPSAAQAPRGPSISQWSAPAGRHL